MRIFSKVDEESKILIPINVRRKAGLAPGRLLDFEIIRIKGTGRAPHVVVHLQQNPPYLSSMELIMRHGNIELDGEGKIELSDDMLDNTRLKPGHLVEIKVGGTNDKPWVVMYDRGPRRLTTLQEKFRGKKAKRWRTMPIEY